MKKTMIAAGLLMASVTATAATAGEPRAKVGLGSYALTTTVAGAPTSNTYVGSALVGGYSFTDLFAVNAHLYALKHDVFTNIKMNGFDAALRVGHHGAGFTYFAGLGFYNETLSTTIFGVNVSQDFSGGLVAFGLGYNWDNVSLELEGAVRGTEDYAKFSNANAADVAAATGSLNVSYRF